MTIQFIYIILCIHFSLITAVRTAVTHLYNCSQVFAADICFRSSLSKQKQPGFIPTVRKLFLILCLDLFDVIRLVFCQIKCREHLRVRQLHIKALCAVDFKLCFVYIKLKYMTAVLFIL